MTRHRREGGKPLRIIGEADTPTLGQFIRECYDWWRDGCLNCCACTVIDSYESGQSSFTTFEFRMKLLYDLVKGQHGDGVQLPRMQLQLFANR